MGTEQYQTKNEPVFLSLSCISRWKWISMKIAAEYIVHYVEYTWS